MTDECTLGVEGAPILSCTAAFSQLLKYGKIKHNTSRQQRSQEKFVTVKTLQPSPIYTIRSYGTVASTKVYSTVQNISGKINYINVAYLKLQCMSYYWYITVASIIYIYNI